MVSPLGLLSCKDSQLSAAHTLPNHGASVQIYNSGPRSHPFSTHHSPAPGWTLILEKITPKHLHLPTKALAFSINDDSGTLSVTSLQLLSHSLFVPVQCLLGPDSSLWTLPHSYPTLEFTFLQALCQDHPTVSSKLLHCSPMTSPSSIPSECLWRN